jgi:SSS family solute:Na+ symporter
MILAQTFGVVDIVFVLLYLLVVVYLGWLGYMRTKTATDYLLAGRQTHPFIMAMSYGSTFISTSAIVGFGGVAAMFGMSLLWLTVCNIFVGIFISFVFLGGPTRRMGHRLDAHTFPELIGRRYESRFIQVFVALIIFCFMPIYAAAVLIGGTEFITVRFGVDYNVALLIFSVIIAAYVIMGGLKGVMYTDALQGAIMFFGMLILLIFTYGKMGGVTAAHEALSKVGDPKLSLFAKIGFNGFTSMPEFGWGAPKYDLWWTVITTLVLGVGIGVLTQPQLAVRFMTVKSKRELNKAVMTGGIFILCMTGVAFTVGALSNVYFYNQEKIVGTLIGTTEKTGVIVKKERDIVAAVPCKLLHIDTNGDGEADINIIANGYAVEKDGKTIPFDKMMPTAEITELPDGKISVMPHANAFQRALVKMKNEKGEVAWILNPDSIIPNFITSAMPPWFGLLFLLTLLSAAMSTLSSQFHAVGTSFGRDMYELLPGRAGKGLLVTKIGIIIGIFVAVLFSYYNRGGAIVARATAMFFGMCIASFFPAYVGGLFWRRMTKAGAITSIITGFLVSAIWLLFIKDKEARAMGLCYKLFEKHSLLLDKPNWSVVDPLVIALPISIIVAIIVSLMTTPSSKAHLKKCFD